MKKSQYISYAETPNGVVYYNSLHNAYVILSNRLHTLFSSTDKIDDIKQNEPKLYDSFVTKGFIVEDDCNEECIANYRRIAKKLDTTLYHIVVNTTLDCNLDCWYCYETKTPKSKISQEVIDKIKNNIGLTYKGARFQVLKLTFFGGEPLLNFKAIQQLVDFAREFCSKNDITLRLDFTTNVTALSENMIQYLATETVDFQITLDGFKTKHDKTRFFKESKKGTYDRVLFNIKSILDNIPKAFVWVRINFDSETLQNIDDIIKDIQMLDKKRCSIIFRKIWQVDISTINKEDILNAILKLIDNGFEVDYFALPRLEPCFAERTSQALVNYDGKIFKCSTLDDFCDKYTVGKFDEEGNILFDINKIAHKALTVTQENCKKCTIYPGCYGPCSENVKKNGDFCILPALGLSLEELILYNFKLNMLHKTNTELG